MNSDKDLPFTKEKIEAIAKKHPTPFHIYDEQGIRNQSKKLNTAFSKFKGFKNFFAVKACPNPYILEVVKSEGMGVDCSSLPELMLAEAVGFKGEEIMFTSNNTPAKEYKKALELGAIINLDDITHIPFLEEHAGTPERICFRYNPGPLRKTSKGNVIGNPEDAKYGLTREQLFEAYKIMLDRGVKKFGLHTMIASNELDDNVFVETALMLFDLALEVKEKLGIELEFVNFGGGIGIPYKPEEKEVDLNSLFRKVSKVYSEKNLEIELPEMKIVMENGRVITGPFGYLITKTIHEKHIYKDYIGVDASMANLMRPGMYRAYHHISVLGKEEQPKNQIYSIVGSLCENNDMFAIQRKFQKIEIGDFLAIHNSGAHGHAMGFNYNGKLRSAELLLKTNGETQLIRRAETEQDYFKTLDFNGSKYSKLSKN